MPRINGSAGHFRGVELRVGLGGKPAVRLNSPLSARARRNRSRMTRPEFSALVACSPDHRRSATPSVRRKTCAVPPLKIVSTDDARGVTETDLVKAEKR